MKEYLDVVQYLLHAEEMNPDEHDGSYELARETIRAYKNMGDLNNVDYCDLNLLYHMVIGTWKLKIELRKDSIDKSHLPESEKERLKNLLDNIWQRAKNEEYENIAFGEHSIGMFGTGFYSFDTRDEGLAAKTFIGLCIDILDISDDDEIYEKVESYFTSEISGLKTASASAMLHCLKPFTFPILNTNFGNNTIYEYFGLDLQKMKNLTTYSLNCKKIKAFRDRYFKVRNYRIYDKAARMVNKSVTNTKIDYIGVLDYFEHNISVPYKNPDKESDVAKRNELIELKTKGQSVVSELKAMADLCKEKFNLEVSSPIQWLDGSNSKTKKYLWIQMKYKEYVDRPEMIAIFVEMSEKTGRARFRYSLEIKQDIADRESFDSFHKHFDMPLPDDKSLVYVGGKNKYGRSMPLEDGIDVIKNKIQTGEYDRVQISAINDWSDDLSNDDYEQAMLDGISKIIPYYEYVIEKNKITDSTKKEFWPSYEEYPVDITKDEWKKFIQEIEYQHKGAMRVLKCYLDIGGIASPKKMSDTYKGHSMVYTGSISNTSRRALKYFGMDACFDEKNNTQWQFPIAFQGKRGDGDETGFYVYKMRPELMEALKEINLDGFELEYKKGRNEIEKVEYDKNTILYGPPGTGKTYSSILYSVGICDGKSLEELKNEDYSDVLERFKELRSEGRIAFTTFHQSYGYEEFIEGIKPVIENSTSNSIQYKIEDGTFKRFCSNYIDINSKHEHILLNNKEMDYQRLFDLSWRAMIDDIIKNKGCFSFPREDKKPVEIQYDESNGNLTVGASGQITKNQVFKRWIKRDETISNSYQLSGGSIYWFERYEAVIKCLIKRYGLPETNKDILCNPIIENEKILNKVFIIDEINRGNISKIFGELITLIEDTKRAGMPEAMSAVLPYSGDVFSVPQNVYILGTMNTADRSIALMDTALRRRFQFIEMMPDSNVLQGITVEQDGISIDIAKMLEIINLRIEYLYDREHTIGHAYFMPLLNDPSIEKLAEIFDKNLIPLLKEYFYEDYGKIQMILGDNKKSSDDLKFIKDIKLVTKDIFNGDTFDLDLPEQIYTIQKEALYNIRSYKEISKDL